MPFVRLVVTPSDALRRDAVSAALFAAGALGLQELGDAWVTVLTSSGDDAALLAALVLAARRADAAAAVQVSELPEVDWSEAWRVGIRAHELGTLTVVPPWLAEGRDAARTIVIEPEMAFGTGEHETTRCVVRLMQGAIRAGDTVADLGAGSAVLAIAAAKLGATRVAPSRWTRTPSGTPSQRERNGVTAQVTVLGGGRAAALVAPCAWCWRTSVIGADRCCRRSPRPCRREARRSSAAYWAWNARRCSLQSARLEGGG